MVNEDHPIKGSAQRAHYDAKQYYNQILDNIVFHCLCDVSCLVVKCIAHGIQHWSMNGVI